MVQSGSRKANFLFSDQGVMLSPGPSLLFKRLLWHANEMDNSISSGADCLPKVSICIFQACPAPETPLQQGQGSLKIMIGGQENLSQTRPVLMQIRLARVKASTGPIP